MKKYMNLLTDTAYLLKCLGGRDGKDLLQRCLTQLFTNELATQCSWFGQRGNFKIKDLNSIKILTGTYRCEVCQTRYKHATSLRKHLTFECQKEPKFHCHYCAYKAKRLYNLRRHIKLKHQVKRGYFMKKKSIILKCSSEISAIVPSLAIPVRRTRKAQSAHPFVVNLQRCRTALYQNSFIHRSARLFNSLPEEVFPTKYNLQKPNSMSKVWKTLQKYLDDENSRFSGLWKNL
ncbi:unnamed protein product [Phaedon cochleariae]|uniref:C2H2-type domain-containing protein n=1 Tax=Phaedon cochleariae TaxID=80249 RepID=A0A9N9SDQ5_PHACE|nr:unnamed protein product [Phaedon cochleariae]